MGLAAMLVGAACRHPDSPPSSGATTPEVLIFAAASLQSALDALAAPAREATGVALRMSYAASSALARQIEHGAPADLFISADQDWMDDLAARARIQPDSRSDLLVNRLVLIASGTAPVTLAISPGFSLVAALGPHRLALADPVAVPAGKYARAALVSLGVWEAVADRIAAAENVRAALRLVALGEASLGIVYRTDALAEPAVVIVETFPETTHPPIVYPVALTVSASSSASAVLAFLQGPAARAVFTREGFGTPDRD
jgi:molybdate transport system substrate-binding protein